MSMFTNYDNLPSSYIPNNVCKKNPYIGNYPPKQPFVITNANGEAVGYKWKYGDTIVLNFTISGNITYSAEDQSNSYTQSVATYMNDSSEQIVFRIFNFRYEMIYEAFPVFHCNDDGTVDVSVFIYDTLSDILVKGRYFISLGIVGTHNNPLYNEETNPDVPKTIQVRQTIFKPEECPITID